VSTKKVTESVKTDEMETSSTGFHRESCSVPSPLSSPWLLLSSSAIGAALSGRDEELRRRTRSSSWRELEEEE
jgi:hypothetical protein